jgi:hypothetical protein
MDCLLWHSSQVGSHGNLFRHGAKKRYVLGHGNIDAMCHARLASHNSPAEIAESRTRSAKPDDLHSGAVSTP